MKKTILLLRNEEGSVMVIALFIMVLLLIMGINATNMSRIEMQILRNAIMQKQDFYSAEGGVVEVATDVNLANPDRVAVCGANDRSSDCNTYAIKKIDTPVVLTATQYGAQLENPSATQVDNYTDTNWPVNHDGTDNEHAYRVYFKGEGPIPKGYGAGFSSYIFDVSVRKQNADAGGAVTRSAIINEGFRKIGPKS
jgi:hypothetical protein